MFGELLAEGVTGDIYVGWREFDCHIAEIDFARKKETVQKPLQNSATSKKKNQIQHWYSEMQRQIPKSLGDKTEEWNNERATDTKAKLVTS
jgi:hypothetical protein